MFDGETYVAKSTSKVAPLRRVDQLSHRERNKIEKLAHKRGLVYVLDLWDGQCAFVVVKGGEWLTPAEWNQREMELDAEDFRSGEWLRRIVPDNGDS